MGKDLKTFAMDPCIAQTHDTGTMHDEHGSTKAEKFSTRKDKMLYRKYKIGQQAKQSKHETPEDTPRIYRKITQNSTFQVLVRSTFCEVQAMLKKIVKEEFLQAPQT